MINHNAMRTFVYVFRPSTILVPIFEVTKTAAPDLQRMPGLVKYLNI